MEKQRREESKRRREEERRSERRKSEKKEDAGRQRGRKVAIHCVFTSISSSGGSRSRLGKAAGAEPCGQMRDEKIARRCGAKHFSKPKNKNISHPDRFWKLRRRKSSRRCGEKQISKSKVLKNDGEREWERPFFDVEMWKEWTRLRRGAQVQAKMYKAH